jgi:ADP-ribosylglycohydrolase
VGARITWAAGLAAGLDGEQLTSTVYRLVGTGLATQESVPAAFAVASASPDDPWRACRIAASLGGDCDTIAAMTGAICGAGTGAAAFPPGAVELVAAVNGLDLGGVAGRLLAVRAATERAAASPGGEVPR